MVGHWLLQQFGAEVIEARFEDWDGPPGRFALVYAATAWHWVDPAVRYQKAAKMLEDVYDEIGEGLPPDYVLPRPQDLPNERAEIERGGLFDVVDVR